MQKHIVMEPSGGAQWTDTLQSVPHLAEINDDGAICHSVQPRSWEGHHLAEQHLEKCDEGRNVDGGGFNLCSLGAGRAIIWLNNNFDKH